MADFITAVEDTSQPQDAIVPILDLINMTINAAILDDPIKAKELYKTITGEEPPEGVLTQRSISIILPEATRINIQDLEKIYEGAKKALEVA